MKKNILGILVLTAGILITGVINSPVGAQTISYPVTELGSCADKSACKVYCDNQTNVDACLSFAEKNNLMSKEEIKVAKNFKNKGMTGPGGCKGKDECKTYCNGPDHMDECVTFAEKNGMMSGKKLEEAKKVKGAIAKGIKPPACGGKEACDVYCSSLEHVEECVNFGEAAGIISKEDTEKIRKGPDGKKGQGNRREEKNLEGQQGQGPGGQGGPGGPNGGGGKGPGGQGGPGGGRNGKGEKGKGGPGQGGGKGPGGQGGQGPGGQQGPGGGGPEGGGQGQGPGGQGGPGGPNGGGGKGPGGNGPGGGGNGGGGGQGNGGSGGQGNGGGGQGQGGGNGGGGNGGGGQ